MYKLKASLGKWTYAIYISESRKEKVVNISYLNASLKYFFFSILNANSIRFIRKKTSAVDLSFSLPLTTNNHGSMAHARYQQHDKANWQTKLKENVIIQNCVMMCQLYPLSPPTHMYSCDLNMLVAYMQATMKSFLKLITYCRVMSQVSYSMHV